MLSFINKLIIRRVNSLYKTFLRVILHINDGVFLSEKLASKRLEACKKCSLFNKRSGMCDVCGCVMLVKVRFKAAKCALEDEGGESKWPI